MKCSFCGHGGQGGAAPRDWKICGHLVLCRECLRRRCRSRTITTGVVQPIGATWQDLLAAWDQEFGQTTPRLIPDRARELTFVENQAVLRMSIADRWWALRLNSARWSRGRRADYNRILAGEAIAEEVLLYRGPTYGGRLQNRFSRGQPQFGIVCKMVVWLPRERQQEASQFDPGIPNQDIELMEINSLRRAIRSNRISFPSQVPTFPGSHQTEWQCNFAQLYFVLGWGCVNIARRYHLRPQQVRRILNVWKQRAAKAGYMQHIPPAGPYEQAMQVARHVEGTEAIFRSARDLATARLQQRNYPESLRLQDEVSRFFERANQLSETFVLSHVSLNPPKRHLEKH